MTQTFQPTAAIKLVVWDMDDTFWKGTLSEEAVVIVDENVNIVKSLVDRGIMSSISSKNDFAAVKQQLVQLDIWDLFIFPQISWSAKGAALANIMESANLRPDNILFIDDNALNIEEVKFRFPTIMAAHPDDVLHLLLDLDHAKGKDDRNHTRLQQYKQLELKAEDLTKTALSNEDFLRQCDIKLRFDYDIERHFDRVVELINRSNQLNYTKIRLDNEIEVEQFKKDLQHYAVVSGVIFARDRYGDHGLIGFFMQFKNEQENKLIHYVWSCRMMNAGLEQYVYERLGRPEIMVVEPVANPIQSFEKIDWIAEISEDSLAAEDAAAPKLLLLGSCDLAAVSSYCSSNRVEYVNGFKGGVMTRCDDFGFILNDATAVASSAAVDRVPCWGKADFKSFHADLKSSEILIISFAAAMKGAYLLTDDGVTIRIHPEGLGMYIDAHPFVDMLEGCAVYALDRDAKISLLESTFAFMQAKADAAHSVFVIGANTRDAAGYAEKFDRDMMRAYNDACRAFCRDREGWNFVSIDDVVAADRLIDDRHYTRLGYFDIANYINNCIRDRAALDSPSPRQHAFPGCDMPAIVSRGSRQSRLKLFGDAQGVLAHAKRLLRVLGLHAMVKRLLPLNPNPSTARA